MFFVPDTSIKRGRTDESQSRCFHVFTCRRHDSDLGCRQYLHPEYILEKWTHPQKETRSSRVSHAGGMKACSRWLSEVTPPDHRIHTSRTPAGVPAISVYVIDTHEPPSTPTVLRTRSSLNHAATPTGLMKNKIPFSQGLHPMPTLDFVTMPLWAFRTSGLRVVSYN
ncbi:MAG: hypothetical protein SGI71_10160 [Verrucomicrobiota bacterium]|nr:hypothetical protein [Verrucomicrobiota bacterium]